MNIIVNGGSRGIGKEVVLFLSQDTNNQIIVTGRNKLALKSLSAFSPNIHPVTSDISIHDDLESTFTEKIVRHFNRVDVLINMAGALVSKEFMEIDDKEARLMMETNFFGPASSYQDCKTSYAGGITYCEYFEYGRLSGQCKIHGPVLLQRLQSGYFVPFRVSGGRIQRLWNKCKLYCPGSSPDRDARGSFSRV